MPNWPGRGAQATRVDQVFKFQLHCVPAKNSGHSYTQKLVHRAPNAVMSAKGGTNAIEALELGDRVFARALC